MELYSSKIKHKKQRKDTKSPSKLLQLFSIILTNKNLPTSTKSSINPKLDAPHILK